MSFFFFKTTFTMKKSCVVVCFFFYQFVKDLENVVLADDMHRYQNAVGVAIAAQNDINSGKFTSPAELLPVYLRLPQAERELKAKEEKK